MDSQISTTYHSSTHASSLLSNVALLRQNRQLCDIVLVVGSTRISAHKLVLASFSSYFDAMFCSLFFESSQSEVELKDLDPEAVESLVEFAYTSKLTIDPSSVDKLFAASCMLQITEAIEACSSFVSKILHPQNCLGFQAFADMYSCHKQYEEARLFSIEHFLDVVQYQEFLMLSPDLLCSLLSEDNLNVSKEEEVFEAFLAWLEFSVVDRLPHAPQVLHCLRLDQISPHFLLSSLQRVPGFRENNELLKIALDVFTGHLLGGHPTHMTTTYPRKGTTGYLYILGGADNVMSIEEYNPRTDKWRTVTSWNSRKLRVNACLVDRKIYVVGGRDGLKPLATVDAFDVDTSTWVSCKQMHMPRHGLGVVALCGLVYAIGGHDSWAHLSSVERFDPSTDSWTVLPDMSIHRNLVGVATLGNQVYVVGGRDNTTCLNSVERFNPLTNRWTTLADMSVRRAGAGVTSLNGSLYVAGGQDVLCLHDVSKQLNSCERYNPQTNEWVTITPMHNCKHAVGLGSLGSWLFAVGGVDSNSSSKYLDSVERYDPRTNDWVQVEKLKHGQAAVCVISLKSRIGVGHV